MIVNPNRGRKVTYPLSPDEVYRQTRPADWLPLPAPSLGEVYMLFHIPSGGESLCAFEVTCSGNYTVSVGTISNGSYSAGSTYSVGSGSTWEHKFDSSDYGNETSDGMKQAIIKIVGSSITHIRPMVHSDGVANVVSSSVVDIRCLLPDGVAFICGGMTNRTSLKSLRYFSGEGGNFNPRGSGAGATTVIGMFQFCESLLTVRGININGVTSVSGMFSYCSALIAVPNFNTSSVTDFSSMFLNCTAIEGVPSFNFNSALIINGLFRGCSALISVGDISAPLVTNAQNLFTECGLLRTIGEINIPSATSIAAAFQNCSSLMKISKLTFSSALTNVNVAFTNLFLLGKILLESNDSGISGITIALSNCSLSHGALVSLFNNLPTVTSATLNIIGNFGTSELTESELAIATAKGWSVTT